MRESLRAILEVSVFEAVFFVCAWHFEAALGRSYGWYSKAAMIFLGFGGLLLHGMRGRYYPLSRNLGFSLKWSAYVGLLFLSCSVVAAAFSIFLGSFRPPSVRTLLSDLVWFLVFVGFAEELFFRGYVQERLNEAFRGRFSSILGVRFEWHQGTLIAAVLFFGVPHLLTAVNPFTGRAIFSVGVLAVTASACFMGVVLGVIKEKTGGILLPTVIHGLLDFTVFGIGRATGLFISSITSVVALFLFFALCFERILLN